MFDSIDIKKELIKVRSSSKNDFLDSVKKLLDKDVIKENNIEKNIIKSNSRNYFAEIKTRSNKDIFNTENEAVTKFVYSSELFKKVRKVYLKK